LYSVRTGESARTLLMQTQGFQHLERDSETAAVFNRALIELTRLVSAQIIATGVFANARRIVDLGGGSGELLAAILRANVNAAGVLFDMEHAIEHGRRHLQNLGLAARCEFIVGDFFEAVPEGADCYILKSVLHDWNDERCRILLHNCRQALPPSGRLLIIETLLPERMERSSEHQAIACSDLTMLLAHAAQERSQADLYKLLNDVGLRMCDVIATATAFHIVEARRS
jgi:ubiquinone/menaquinone biosynthesis C-methylase UbiE